MFHVKGFPVPRRPPFPSDPFTLHIYPAVQPAAPAIETAVSYAFMRVLLVAILHGDCAFVWLVDDNTDTLYLAR